MLFTCWIPKATDTCSENVILIIFPHKLWLREGASLLGYTCIVCRVYFCLCGFSQHVQSYKVPCAYNPHDAFKINDNKIKIINTRRKTLDVKNFEEPSFDSRQRKRFVSFPSDENGSLFHPISYSLDFGSDIPGYKKAPSRIWPFFSIL